MKIILELIGITIGAGAVGGAIGYLVRKNVAENKIATAEETAIRIIQEAEQTGEAKRKEALVEAKKKSTACAVRWNEKIKSVAVISNVRKDVFCKKKKILTVR